MKYEIEEVENGWILKELYSDENQKDCSIYIFEELKSVFRHIIRDNPPDSFSYYSSSCLDVFFIDKDISNQSSFVYIKEKNMIENQETKEQLEANRENIKGKVIVGDLPISLARYADAVLLPEEREYATWQDIRCISIE